MARIWTCMSGLGDRQEPLADETKHWNTGYSAKILARSWEAVEGFPPEVATALQQTDKPSLKGLTPILAIPECKVPLPGGVRASQNDLFVLAREPVSVMVGPTTWRSSSVWTPSKVSPQLGADSIVPLFGVWVVGDCNFPKSEDRQTKRASWFAPRTPFGLRLGQAGQT